METFAFIHAHVGYDDLAPEPQVRELHLPSSQRLGAAGVAIALSAISLTSAAQALVLPGDRGPAVSDLQRVLQQKGYKLTVDGIYGPDTRSAVLTFQQNEQLTPDGIVGPRTATKLGLASPAIGGPATPTPQPGQAAPSSPTPAAPTAPAPSASQPTATAQANTNSQKISGYVTIISNELRIRSAPNTTSEVLGYLNAKEVVPTTGRIQNGFIELYRGGWIAAEYTNLSKKPASVPSSPPSSLAKIVTDAPAGLRVRSGPGPEYNVVGVLTNGARVDVVGTPRDGWVQLAKGGWVSTSYLK